MNLLLVGISVSAAVALIYVVSQRSQPKNFVVRVVCYTIVAACIPAAVYAQLVAHYDYLLWIGIALAGCLGLLFAAAHKTEERWAVSYDRQGMRIWVGILLGSVIVFGLLLRSDVIDYYLWLAILFGILVGASEILSRYRDEPMIALTSLPGIVYLAINGLISLAALGLLRHYSDGVFPALKGDPLLTCILAGFGAMVVMRSKLFSFKTVGGEEFAVGPDAVITIFLRSVDRAIDRERFARRQRLVFTSTKDVVYSDRIPDFFKGSLSAYQNLTNDEKADISRVVDAVQHRQDLDPHLKLMAIAFGFLNISGEADYSQLIEDLKTFLAKPSASPPVPAAGQLGA